MKRKIIQLAGKTMVVSLPAEWIRKFKVNKGDEVELKEEGKRIIITTDKEFSKEILEINITGLGNAVSRTIHALYKRGFDELKLKFDDKSYKKLIKKALENEAGTLEIIKEGDNFCILKNISSGIESEFDPALRRTFLLLLSMSKAGLKAFENNNFSDLEEAKKMELTNNKLTTFCRRILNKNGYKDPEKLTFIYDLVENLENIADQYKYLFTYLLNEHKKIKLDKKVINYYGEVHNFLNSFYELLYKFDNEKAASFYDDRKRLVEEGYKLMKENKNVIILNHLLAVVQLIFNQLGNLSALSF